MVKIDRGFVLKTFLDRIVEAKRLNMSDIRMSVKELDDVAYVIYGLMSEKLSTLLDSLSTNDIEEKQSIKKKSIKPRIVIDDVKIKKVTSENVEENLLDISKEDDIIEESDDDVYLFGGTF